VDPALLDLALVLGGRGAAGGDQEAVVLGALPIGPLDHGIVEGGAYDGGLEIVDLTCPTRICARSNATAGEHAVGESERAT
jgi:hypothetical protein